MIIKIISLSSLQSQAKALGISEVSLVNYEKGKSSPDMDLGQKMSELYGVPMEMMDFTKVGNRVIKD